MIAIDKRIKVDEINKRNRSTILVIDGDSEKVLSDVKLKDGSRSRFLYDDNYIISYIRGTTLNPIPIDITGAYSIKNKDLLTLDDYRIKKILEYMLITKKQFELAHVLSEINDTDLGLLNKEELLTLRSYLTMGNEKITREDVIKYILNTYPSLEEYKNISHVMTVAEYRRLNHELLIENPSFHTISQDISDISLNAIVDEKINIDYKNIYIKEYEHEQKILKLNKR